MIIRPGLIAASQQGGGSGYIGPLNIVANAVVAFGQRAMSAADRGQPIYTVREDSGDTTQTFNSDPMTGAIDIAAITAFLNGNDGFINSWVNKGSSATNAVQADATKQPQWEVVGGLPTILFDGLNDYLLTIGNITLIDEWTAFAVVIPGPIQGTGAQTNHRPICGQSSDNYAQYGPDWTFEPFISEAAYRITLIAEDIDASNALDVDNGGGSIIDFAENLHLIDCAISILSPDLYIDGASLGIVDTGTHGTNVGSIISPFAIGASGQDIVGTGVHGYGNTLEIIVFPGIVSPANRIALRQNIADYYGIILA